MLPFGVESPPGSMLICRMAKFGAPSSRPIKTLRETFSAPGISVWVWVVELTFRIRTVRCVVSLMLRFYTEGTLGS